tara:strand:+ start:203 stop:601 length:399 start_codon:yes stop_codon:yes gene_type:complete
MFKYINATEDNFPFYLRVFASILLTLFFGFLFSIGTSSWWPLPIIFVILLIITNVTQIIKNYHKQIACDHAYAHTRVCNNCGATLQEHHIRVRHKKHVPDPHLHQLKPPKAHEKKETDVPDVLDENSRSSQE